MSLVFIIDWRVVTVTCSLPWGFHINWNIFNSELKRASLHILSPIFPIFFTVWYCVITHFGQKVIHNRGGTVYSWKNIEKPTYWSYRYWNLPFRNIDIEKHMHLILILEKLDQYFLDFYLIVRILSLDFYLKSTLCYYYCIAMFWWGRLHFIIALFSTSKINL